MKTDLTREQIYSALLTLERKQHFLRLEYTNLQKQRVSGELNNDKLRLNLKRMRTIQAQIFQNKRGPNGLRNLNKRYKLKY